MALRDRLRKLRKGAEGEMFDVACPECGQRFRGAGDVATDVMVAEWRDGAGHEREPDPLVDAILGHPHEALLAEVLREFPGLRDAR